MRRQLSIFATAFVVLAAVGCTSTFASKEASSSSDPTNPSSPRPAPSSPAPDSPKEPQSPPSNPAPDAGTVDGGKPTQTPDPQSETIDFVAPLLTVKDGVYTASFRLKNNASENVVEFSKIEVVGVGGTFPLIDRALCPSTTPGYQWDVPAGQLSSSLGIAFASSAAREKAVIDCTCGSKEVLQSVLSNFDATPPFEVSVTFVMLSGKLVTSRQLFVL